MRDASRRFAVWFGLWILVLAATPFSRAADAQRERRVVLITIDGFPAAMFSDPKTPIPRIRELAAQGSVAEGMRVSNPSVTWPNHTTLVTGVHAEKHAVLFNGVVTRRGPDQPVSVDPKKTKAELVAVPTLFDLLHEKGFRTAGINWPSTRESKALDDDFPDSPDTLVHSTPRLRAELVAEGILPSDKDADFRALTGPARDEVWTRAACHVIKKRKPHLLLFHLLNIDGTHHRYGPQSPASYTALALADVHVGKILDALTEAGIRTNTTVILTADHGFAVATNILQPNVLFRQAGLLEVGASNVLSKARVQLISEGGTGMIYLNNPETREADRQKVLALLRGKEGVGEIIQPDHFGRHGYPQPAATNGMADLVLAAKDGYGISGSAVGDDFVVHASLKDNIGYHGYLANNPKMNAAFIAEGPGIKRGAKIGTVEAIDVAPTIAHLLGQKLNRADGKVLTGILD
jgi:predicted AlkP superfamily pyrophosphatase or phosphodiesterase